MRNRLKKLEGSSLVRKGIKLKLLGKRTNLAKEKIRKGKVICGCRLLFKKIYTLIQKYFKENSIKNFV